MDLDQAKTLIYSYKLNNSVILGKKTKTKKLLNFIFKADDLNWKNNKSYKWINSSDSLLWHSRKNFN